jgi:RNA polymerase sigma-70 factor (ECF subfamily)
MNELVERWPAERAVSRDADFVREFEAHLTDCSPLVFRVAYSVLRNVSDADDVAQEAFVRAYRRMRGLRDRQRFRSWIVRITWRLALDWRRKERRRSTREDAVARVAPAVGSLEADLVATERQVRLWAAIDELPSRLRLVVVLAAIEEHGVKAVAEILGIPDGTVKSRLFEARRRLQERLR